MPDPVDLLLITWNRRRYAEKTIANLLADPADFRLYCWDNASEDGTADLIASLDDPRIVVKHFSKKNLKQRVPCLWFFEMAESDVIGKVDDDILLPHGWIERIAPMVRAEPRFGMVWCWVFMEDDWDEELAQQRSMSIGGRRVLPIVGAPGCGWLARKEHILKHATYGGYGLPVDRVAMTLNGLVHGCALPVLFAHHMDDPRSPHYVGGGLNRPDASLTAKSLRFASEAAYAEWIANDARRKLTENYRTAVRDLWLARRCGAVGRRLVRLRRRLRGGLRQANE